MASYHDFFKLVNSINGRRTRIFIQHFCRMNFSYYNGADVEIRLSPFTAVELKHVILEVN
jgi:hypothetical protein